jgi:hypothetical protein
MAITTPYNLVDALDGAVSGDTILLEDGVVYNLSPYKDLVIKSGVTLKGNNASRANRPILYYDRTFADGTLTGMLRAEAGTSGQSTIIDNIAMDGGHPKPIGSLQVQNALRIEGPYVTVSNCEIENFLKWGVHILNMHKQTIYNCQFKNIWYSDGTGYGYGIWGNGTNTDSVLQGAFPAIADITKIMHCSFTEMRNGFDCSQPGNSISVSYNRFGRFYQAGFDQHDSYPFGDVYVQNNIFSAQGGQASMRVFGVTNHLTITENHFWRSAPAMYLDPATGIGTLWSDAYGSDADFPPAIETSLFTIKDNAFRRDDV